MLDLHKTGIYKDLVQNFFSVDVITINISLPHKILSSLH